MAGLRTLISSVISTLVVTLCSPMVVADDGASQPSSVIFMKGQGDTSAIVTIPRPIQFDSSGLFDRLGVMPSQVVQPADGWLATEG